MEDLTANTTCNVQVTRGFYALLSLGPRSSRGVAVWDKWGCNWGQNIIITMLIYADFWLQAFQL